MTAQGRANRTVVRATREARPAFAARRALAALMVLGVLSATTAATASSALDLVRAATAHETAHDDDRAVRLYMEALALDPGCAEAYLGLGSLRTRLGDLREAERVYSVALEHVPGLRAARLARAHVRRALGARSAAIDDLGGTDDDVEALRVLAAWHGEDGETPSQLKVWRRMVARAEAIDDDALRSEARTMVRALTILVGPADPAAAPTVECGVRALVASLARKGGGVARASALTPPAQRACSRSRTP